MLLKENEIALIIRYIDAHSSRGHHKCPTCKQNDWIIEGPLSQTFIEYNQVTQNWATTPHILPVVFLRCADCGYIETYAWLPILDWGQENGE